MKPASAEDGISGEDAIAIHGARHHNLKNLSLAIPRGKFVVVTGDAGGELVIAGTPEQVTACEWSHMGAALRGSP